MGAFQARLNAPFIVKVLFAPAALMVSYPVEKRDIVANITPGFLTLNPFVAKNFLSFA